MKKKAERTIIRTIRLTESEAIHIQQQAAAVGVTPSEWIRAAAMGKHVRTAADMEVLNELRRQGGLLKHLFNQGALDPATSWAVLKKFEEVAGQLIRGGESHDREAD